MDTHVKVVAALNIALGALGLAAALIVLLVFGGAAGIVGLSDAGPEGGMAAGIIGLVGGGIVLLVLIVSLPGLIAGIGLLSYKEWARILTIVLSVLNLLNIPFGTAIGIYSLWVLLSRDTTHLFAAQRPA